MTGTLAISVTATTSTVVQWLTPLPHRNKDQTCPCLGFLGYSGFLLPFKDTLIILAPIILTPIILTCYSDLALGMMGIIKSFGIHLSKMIFR